MDDERLYRQYVNGNRDAADMLVDRYADALTLYINGFIGDIHEAEDLMIESFALIFAKARPIRGERGFRGYLYRIARNLAFRHRKKRRIRFVSVEDIPFELSEEALAETPLYQEERKRHLYEAMEELKNEYKEALYLVYFEEMSYRQAGGVMGKTERQITKLIYRGKQNLKKILDRKGFTYEDK